MVICILSNRPDVARHYVEVLRSRGVEEIEVTTEVFDLFDLLTSRNVCGIALDIPAVVRASEHGKQLLNNINEIYPVVKLNWAPGKEMMAVVNRFVPATDTPLESFVAACRDFHPRSLRKHERIAKVINLHWWVENGAKSRGFILDISGGGCFVCAFDPPPVGSMVTIELIVERRIITAEVMWVSRWGEMERAPGFGCAYR